MQVDLQVLPTRAHHVCAPVRPCIHFGSGQHAHSITHPLGWRTRHTAAGTDSATLTAMNFPGFFRTGRRLGDPARTPFSFSSRRALYSACTLSPVCRQYSTTLFPWLCASCACSAAVNPSCCVSISTSVRGNSPQRGRASADQPRIGTTRITECLPAFERFQQSMAWDVTRRGDASRERYQALLAED